MSIALLLGIFFLLLVFGILVKVFRRVWAAFLTIIILAALAVTGLVATGNQQFMNWVYTVNPFVAEQAEPASTCLSSYYLEPLSPDASSSTSEGSAAYGAIIQLGDLDRYGRSTFAHIRLSESQEPGNNGQERNEYINVDPEGWRNFKIDGNWANNRCHLIGYQFSGLNDELRNLSIGTSYLNKGTEGSGMDESNPDGMLFYEQRLDDWLHENPEKDLDLYVRPVYEGSNTTPTCYYMQWVGFDTDNTQVSIDIGGHSKTVSGAVSGVLLTNQSPSYRIDYATGIITEK